MIAPLLRRVSVILLFLLASFSPVVAFNASAQQDELTCDDFTNQDAAQIVLDLDDTYEDTLDEDGDGEACPDLPARDDDNGGGGGSSLDATLTLGSDVDDFEEQVGDPSDDADANDFTVGTVYDGFGDYDSVTVYWLDDIAAHIQVELSDELSEDDAYNVALTLLPDDADVETNGDELDGGELVFSGESNELADTFFDEDYDGNDVGGAPGDLRMILIPGKTDYAIIDVAIGLGDEYSGIAPLDGTDDSADDTADDGSDDSADSGSDSGSDGGDLDADAAEYLDTVREGTDQMLTDITDFATLLSGGSNLTDAQIDQLADILARWAGLEEEAASLDAPKGYEKIQSTYEDAAAALTDVSANITAYLTESDDAALDDAFDSLTEATTLLTTLDGLLTDEGV